MATGTESAFSSVLALYHASRTPSVKQACLLSLAAAPTPALVQRLLQASINTSIVRSQDTGTVMRSLAAHSHLGAASAWTFIQQHWKAVFAAQRFGVVRTLKVVTAYLSTASERAALVSLLDGPAADAVGAASRKALLEAIDKNQHWVATTRGRFLAALASASAED